MIDLTLIVLGNLSKKNEDKNIEIIYDNGDKINDCIKNAKGKYIAFIKEEDNIKNNYLKLLLEECKKDFDCCFINYTVNYNYKNPMKIATEKSELSNYKPYYGEYIWSFIYKKECLNEIIKIENKNEFNSAVEQIFKKTNAINKIIYYHNPSGRRLIKDFQYSDVKRNEYYKNAIYMGLGCNGCFNGYISWLKNIGRCFSDKYDITILYQEMPKKTYDDLSKYFRCIKVNRNINYVCERFATTYSDFFYPKNMFVTDQSYMFIHGNMSDYENVRKFYDDIYDHYVAVSKIAQKKAKGYFPTDNIECIFNPYKLDKEALKPHLRLISAFRYSQIKRPDRVEKMAKLMDEMDIPYTWNLFTDTKENTSNSGLIYRKRVPNPLPYIADSDYLVLLSDSESMGYCVIEAMSVNTKVVVTPLEAYDELGLNDDNAIIIPFDYFETKNEDKLKEVILRMYNEKDKKIKYKIDESLWEDYNNVFIK